MKKIYLYLTGQSQGFGLPKWIYRISPKCTGTDKWEWFSIPIRTEGCLGGETLFMYWRRKLTKNDIGFFLIWFTICSMLILSIILFLYR